jgi:FkbM family methyltransferase
VAGVSVVGGVLWYASQDPDPHRVELAIYREQYGSERHSRHGEEWYVRDFFRDRRGGTFVDVGAYHHEQESNTYYLEVALGWSGIAVDANPAFAEGYARHRPRTRFMSFFVSDRSDAQATLFIPRRFPLMASGDRDFASASGSGLQAQTVPTITLTDLLEQAGLEEVDFLNMDIELAEPKALAGFDIGRFRPKLVCIEGHREVRQAILDYFSRSGYILVGDYLRADPWNLWFAPIPPQPLIRASAKGSHATR